jgi:hypothetical protein
MGGQLSILNQYYQALEPITQVAHDGVQMIRAVSLMAMGATFLLISPKLQGDLAVTMASATTAMETYSPYSYIAGAIVVVLTFMIAMYRGAQPH